VSQTHAAVSRADRDTDPTLTGYEPGQFMLDLPGRFHLWYSGAYLGLREGSDLFPETLVTLRGEVAIHADLLVSHLLAGATCG
jgi:hypothetical protein